MIFFKEHVVADAELALKQKDYYDVTGSIEGCQSDNPLWLFIVRLKYKGSNTNCLIYHASGMYAITVKRTRLVFLDCTPGEFITYILTYCVQTELRWRLPNEFDTAKLLIFLKFAICFIVLLNLGETCHLKGCDIVMVWSTLLLLRWYDCSALWRGTCIVT